MRAMGFGNRFISYLQVLYSDAESLVKICGSLTTPFSFEKGIRQGCPLSGLLYSIAIEPLLINLRKNLNDRDFHIPTTDFSCAVSAHAEYIWEIQTTTFNKIGKSAKINSTKPCLPGLVFPLLSHSKAKSS